MRLPLPLLRMTFITIGQYFNKLHSGLFTLLIIPVMVFSALYFFVGGKEPDPRMEYYLIVGTAVLLDWAMAMVIFNKKIKSARNEQGLGAKLDKYFKITIVRYGILSSASLMLALGLYLTRSDFFTAMYVAGLIFSGTLWPTGRKVSEDLRLRGDERQMVYFKKDKW